MPQIATIAKGIVFEDSGASLMSRMLGTDAAVVTQADITSIALNIFDVTDSANPVADGSNPVTVTVADVIFDTLQTDARWSKDSTGYNFRYDTLATQVPTGATVVRFEFEITPASGQVFFDVYEVDVLAIHKG